MKLPFVSLPTFRGKLLVLESLPNVGWRTRAIFYIPPYLCVSCYNDEGCMSTTKLTNITHNQVSNHDMNHRKFTACFTNNAWLSKCSFLGSAELPQFRGGGLLIRGFDIFRKVG